MSRRSITSVRELQSLLDAHQHQAGETGARHLVVLMLQAGADTPEFSLLTSTNAAKPAHRVDASDRIAGWLGTNRSSLFWSTGKSWRIAELAAAIGSLQSGGVAVVFVTPEALGESALLTRVLAGVDAHREVAQPSHAHAEAALPEVCSYRLECSVRHTDVISQRSDASRRATENHRHPGSISRSREPAIAEQNRLKHRVLAYLSDNETIDPALVIITGPRGTGKSALLGQLHAHLSVRGAAPLVTAPRRSAIQSLQHFSSAAVFTPADRAAGASPAPLIIDEAASLPVAQLRQLVTRHAPVVLATTTEGYEPGGRAFALRTVQTLTALRPGCLHVQTQHPMRWRPDDAIDPLMRNALLLPVDDVKARAPGHVGTAKLPIRIERLYAQDFHRNSSIARKCVDLLNDNHYQSTLAATDDLLSGRVASFAAMQDEQLLGIATTVEEKAIPGALHNDILANRRRLPDRLLPQLLARCSNQSFALDADFQRIVRIAVVSSARRRGVGRQLVSFLCESHNEATSVGAVFALDDNTAAFWSALGFTCFHQGQRANPRSGRTSAAVLRTGNPVISDTLRLAATLMQDNREPARHPLNLVRDHALLKRLIAGERGLAETRGPLYRLWWSVCNEPVPFTPGSPICPEIVPTMTARQRERAIIDWARQRLEC